ncbi:MAG: tetratricopeptide repeat protein [Cyanothece sp. SIO1E1]|nr:tetratricopeptide repeat protein [Cyanothece sp. SIO1E1]
MGRLSGGQYQFIKVLGSDELGQTYLAADLSLAGHPRCIIKRLYLPHKTPEELNTIVSLLVQKASILKKIGQHDQLPQIQNFFIEDQDFYLVQDFIPGHPLTAEILSAHPVAEGHVTRILEEILAGLHFVHQQGLAHGRLKPANVIRRHSDQKLVLTDLGLVKATLLQIRQTRGPLKSSQVQPQDIYTPVTLRQGQGQEQGQFSHDFYALGMIGIQTLTGLSNEALAHIQQTSQINNKTILWQDYAQTQVSLGLMAILSRMICTNSQSPYQSTTAILVDLKSHGSGTQGFKTSSGRSTQPKPSRSPRIPQQSLLRGALCLMAVAGIAIAYRLEIPQTLIVKHFLNRGLIAQKQGKAQQAIAHYTKAIQFRPTNQAYRRRGASHFALGASQVAIADLTQAIQIEPQDVQAYYQRGNIRFQLGDLQGALADYTQAIQLDPNLTHAYVNRGSVWAEQGHDQKAVVDYTQAIQIQPDLPAAYLNRCLSRSNLNDQSGAIEDCTQAINLRPDYAFAYQNRGLAHRRLDNLQAAIQDFNVAIQLNPDDADPYYNRGLVRNDLGDQMGAIADYTQAIQHNPNHAAAYYDRGLIYAKIGNSQQAIQDFQKTTHLCLDIGRLGCHEDAQYQIQRLEQSAQIGDKG